MDPLRAVLSLVVSLSLGGVGCADEFDPAWDLKTFRVLGVQVTNVSRPSEPRAAEVAPGETVRLTLTTYDPMPGRALQVVWLFCPQTERMGNTFGCTPSAEFPPLMGTSVSLTIPRTTVFGVDPQGRSRVQALIFACAGGTPGVDPDTRTPTCTGDAAESITVIRSIVVRTRETVEINRNPELTEVVFYPGAVLSNPVVLREGTPTLRVPRCSGDPCLDHLIELRVTPESRELYETLDIRAQRVIQPERLQFGFYFAPPLMAPRSASQQRARGRMDGTFFVDTAERPNGPVRKKWNAPTTPGVVEFVFNVSDVRGGYDSTRRSILVE
jgi:hypothetical protein